MHNVFYDLFPTVVLDLFKKLSVTKTHITRFHNINFVVENSRLELRHKFITIYGVITWNNLPSAIKHCTTLNIFKKLIKSHIMLLPDNS